MDMFDPDEVIATTPEGEEVTRARALDDIQRDMRDMAELWQEMSQKFDEAKDSPDGVFGMAVAMSYEVVHQATHEIRDRLQILSKSEIQALMDRTARPPAPAAPPIDVEAEIQQIPDAFNPEDWA